MTVVSQVLFRAKWTIAQEDSSEKLLPRGRSVYIYVILVKGEHMQSGTYFLQKFLLVM